MHQNGLKPSKMLRLPMPQIADDKPNMDETER